MELGPDAARGMLLEVSARLERFDTNDEGYRSVTPELSDAGRRRLILDASNAILDAHGLTAEHARSLPPEIGRAMMTAVTFGIAIGRQLGTLRS